MPVVVVTNNRVGRFGGWGSEDGGKGGGLRLCLTDR